jgi:hypothetical protein
MSESTQKTMEIPDFKNPQSFEGFQMPREFVFPAEFVEKKYIKRFDLNGCDVAVFLVIVYLSFGFFFDFPKPIVTYKYLSSVTGFSVDMVQDSMDKLLRVGLLKLMRGNPDKIGINSDIEPTLTWREE